ncbi:unnamed protein product, partial [Staurois parvus]
HFLSRHFHPLPVQPNFQLSVLSHFEWQLCSHATLYPYEFISIFLRQIKLYFGGIYSPLGNFFFCYINEKSKIYKILQINNLSS